MYGEYVFIRWFYCSLVSVFINEFYHLLLVRCDWEICHHLCAIVLKRSRLKPFSAFCVNPWEFLEPFLCKTYDSLAQTLIIS
jgi:hypothetical protein